VPLPKLHFASLLNLEDVEKGLGYYMPRRGADAALLEAICRDSVDYLREIANWYRNRGKSDDGGRMSPVPALRASWPVRDSYPSKRPQTLSTAKGEQYYAEPTMPTEGAAMRRRRSWLSRVIGFVAIGLASLVVPMYGQAASDVLVTVVPQSPTDQHAVARITRIELDGDSLRLEIENMGPSDVIALTVRYEMIGCAGEYASTWSTGGGDTRRVPGMYSIDLPAHGRTWLEDDPRAPNLAFSALREKTRYVRVYAEVTATARRDGSIVQWEEFGLSKHEAKPLDPNVCANWPWEKSLDAVTAFSASPRGSGTDLHRSSTVNDGVQYSCEAVDAVLHCAGN